MEFYNKNPDQPSEVKAYKTAYESTDNRMHGAKPAPSLALTRRKDFSKAVGPHLS